MLDIQLTPDKRYLRFKESTYNEAGVAENEKTAFKQIQVEKAATALAWAKAQKWAFSAKPTSGDGQIFGIEQVKEGELVTAGAEEAAV
jgi:hypothetical protein